MQTEYKGQAVCCPKDVNSWREWLANNHASADGVWVIFYKKGSGVPSISWSEAVDQALCFGWIDSKPNKRDDKSFYRYFAPRNPKSSWSGINKSKIDKLTKSGLMHPAGLKLVETAKANGTWNALDDIENLVIPGDLQQRFEESPLAHRNWQSFPKSVKRGILEWISNAKRPATRLRRIEETVTKAEQNIRANQYRS